LGQYFGIPVTCFAGSSTFYQEYQPVKGYMSSVNPRLHFGLGNATKVDSIQILWPNGQQSLLQDIAVNQLIAPTPDDMIKNLEARQSYKTLFGQADVKIPFRHRESHFVDFDRDRLRFWMISNEGPKAAKADINGDYLEDLFIPGAKGQTSMLLQQTATGNFVPSNAKLFDQDSLAEDILGHFFDANGDGHQDLIVGSGGIEFADNSSYYRDRLYLNNGAGDFMKSEMLFSPKPTSFILSVDLDGDQDEDLIVGYRSIPFAYGIPTGLEIWNNDGSGVFNNASSSYNPDLKTLGMLTDAKWADLDQDGSMELILVGEWMPLRIFSYVNKNFTETTEKFGFQNTNGLWNTVNVEDFNGDGLPDVLAGNIGLNTRLHTSPEDQLQLIINDFDQNGAIEHILVSHQEGKSIPWAMKNTLIKQLPSLRKQLPTYASYQSKSLEELFPPTILSKSLTLTLDKLASTLWINQGDGTFLEVSLPEEIQSSPIYSIEKSTSLDGKNLILVGGNQSRIKPELGSQLGSYGWVLVQTSEKEWTVLLPEESGIKVDGEIRSMLQLTIKNKPHLILFKSNDETVIYEIR